MERLLSVRKHLVEWWSTLPEVTDCRDLNPAGPLFRSNVHLKLDYCLTRIFIGRPFLFSNIRGINPTASQGPTPPFKMTSGTSKNRTILVTDCVEAALEIVDLCRLLRDETGLARASFTEFSSCRAALLVILAQSLTKRTERLREALDKGMGLIKIMSMGVGSARSAVSVIEALERAIRRLEDWSSSQGGSNNMGIVESAYDRFKNWEMLWKSGPLSPTSNPFYPDPTNDDDKNTAIPPATPITNTADISSPDPMDRGLTTAANTANNALTHGNTIPTSSDFSPSNGTGAVNDAIPPLPHFGFDHFVSNFPQELDEFTAIPCFEIDPQQAGQAQGPAPGQAQTQAQAPAQSPQQGLGLGEADSRWMQFINN